jgi:RNA polymerase sigma factor (sigma-70 family)
MKIDFGTTHWSLILALKDAEPERTRQALAELCRRYWYPLYSVIRRRVHDADQAADLTQDFFLHLIEKDALRRADPALGRLRSFLIASVKNFLANERDRAVARKRGGEARPVTFDEMEADRRYQVDARAGWDQERAFDHQWALTVLRRALARLRSEFEANGRAAEFDHLCPFLTGDGGERPYREIASSLGTTEAAVKSAVRRLRRRYGETLREEIAETLSDPGDCEAELRYLLAALEA